MGLTWQTGIHVLNKGSTGSRNKIKLIEGWWTFSQNDSFLEIRIFGTLECLRDSTALH